MTTAGPDATRLFVGHALGLHWSALADTDRRALKAFLLDTLCVGVAGAAAPNAEAILSVAASWGDGGRCGVLGRPAVRLPATSAAFVNAFQIHCQEYDCVHEAAVLHPMASVVAALKAESERAGPYDGATYLTALAAGVDIAVALGLAPTTPLKFFRPATAGVFGCVAAIARLRGLTTATTVDAFGYALAFASGTMQAHVEGKPALPVQVANAARSAIVAVDLAVAGLAGPARSIDGPFGYLNLFESAVDLDPVLSDLAQVRRIGEVSCKSHPTGRAAQGGLEALRRLMEHQAVGADDIESLVFRAPPLIKRLVGRPAHEGMDVAYARLCLPWLAAVALTRGDVGLGDFRPERLSDPALIALAARVDVRDDGSDDPAAFAPLVLTAELRDGRRFDVRVDSTPGSPETPLSADQRLRKAGRCLAHAGREGGLDRLAAAVESLESAPDVAAALVI